MDNERVVLGLDVSTSCIGVSIVLDNGVDEKPEILKITHIKPKINNKIKGIEALFLKKKIFEDEFLSTLKEYNITNVVIEEPLLSSNNVNTVATLLRFNGMIADSVYNCLNIVPNFISSYDARCYSFPELMSIRKYNKKGIEYPIKHIKKALKDSNLVLFGAYPFDIDKKQVMMDMVNNLYNNSIPWIYNNKGELIKENYDACDSLICSLAYLNTVKNNVDYAKIKDYDVKKMDNNQTLFTYTTEIWNKVFYKTLILN